MGWAFVLPWILLWFGVWTPFPMGRVSSGWVAGWFACWMSWESITISGWFSYPFHPRGISVVSAASRKHLLPWLVGVEPVKSLKRKELKGFQWGEHNSPSAHGVKTDTIFPPLLMQWIYAAWWVLVAIIQEKSVKAIPWEKLVGSCLYSGARWLSGVGWGCVSLHQPRSCPLVRVTLGLGSSSVYCEIRQFLMLFYPLNPPFGAARTCRSLEKTSVLCARCKVCSSLGKTATCERVLHAGKSILIWRW